MKTPYLVTILKKKTKEEEILEKKREKEVGQLTLIQKVENAKIKIFETCVILANKNAPEGLKNVMVFISKYKLKF